MSEPQHFRVTYNEVHNLIRESAKKIAEFKPDLFIAIGQSTASAFSSFCEDLRSLYSRSFIRECIGGGQVL